MTKSALQIARAAYQPKLPKALKGFVQVKEGAATQSVADQEAIKELFPNTYGMPLIQFVESASETSFSPVNVGVILSGGQAPGGHNVISGLFDGIKKLNADSKLYGFILGPGGLVDHNYMELTADIIDEYRNGVSATELTKKYNLTRARVYKILSNSDEYVSHRVSGVLTLRRAKIIERNKKIIADVKTHPDIPITEIASKYNISPSIVYTVLRTQ